MDFSLTTEQAQFRDSIERFIRDTYPGDTRRQLAASDTGFDRDNWRKFAELGWLAIPFAEAHGGLDGSPGETMILMEAFGRGLVLEPYLSTVVLCGGLIQKAGAPAQQALLPRLIGGDLLVAFAFAERQERFNLADVCMHATVNGSDFVLSGNKSVVFDAASADRIIVSARTGGAERAPEGITLFLVDSNAAGLSRRNFPTIDGGRASEITFDDVLVGRDAAIGEIDQGLPLIEWAVDHGIAAVCAEAVGAMEVLQVHTLEHLKTRKQFGQPIGQFQVLQHRAVEMFMACEQARSMAYMATLKLTDPSDSGRMRAVSAAKAKVGEAAHFVGQQAIQLHGGVGITDELNVGHYFKRLTMIDTLFGNVAHHRKRFADLS
ncbi:MAG: acyl-CoA dehydrogenase family protein [Proteobacteria bacterium]|nr:acyl-CoA dehydrogenase family protein [Pseudomonadota bacterium]